MENQETKLTATVDRKSINQLPTTTGIYIFKHDKEILYIGKSVNLRARLLSHLENAKIDNKEAAIIANSSIIECIIVDSEFKALLLESQLITKYQPKYNARWRDDKSPLYIKITIKDIYPKITSIRKEFDKKAVYFGPFPSVKSVYEILREIRRVFPFCSQKKITKKPCFHSKIGLCNPCPNGIEKTQDAATKKQMQRRYKQNIRNIIKVLHGKTEPVLNAFYTSLRQLANEQKFEEAISVRNKIMHFEHLLHRKLFSPDTIPVYNAAKESQLSLLHLLHEFFPELKMLNRIECFDISNFTQKEATASMVVFTNGLIDKKEYRRFKIRDSKLASDFEMMTEVLERRFRRSAENKKDAWQMPDVLLVDGGRPQVLTTQKVLRTLHITVPVIGIAKHPDRLVVGVDGLPTLKPPIHQPGFNMIRALRDESHRFAKKYHVLLRERRFFNS